MTYKYKSLTSLIQFYTFVYIIFTSYNRLQLLLLLLLCIVVLPRVLIIKILVKF